MTAKQGCAILSLDSLSIKFFKRILANVPLAIIRSLPLLAPYVLKSFFSIPRSFKNFAAGEFTEMFPAGEIWSVVIESPTFKRTLALKILFIGLRAAPVVWKKGGLWM